MKTHRLRIIAFYNVENLFDTTNDTLVFDDGRTPQGRYRWTEKRYKKKIADISKVLSELNGGHVNSSPDVIGLCEVEKRSVLEDLIHHENLNHKDYGIVHFDSPDDRGIDVAMLYRKASFIPITFKSHRLLLFDTAGNRDYTRDQLVVCGFLDGEEFYFLVNHWPSRSGGESASRPNRIKAAALSKRIIDSIQSLNYDAKIIVMGDFNDDPRDESLRKVLGSKGNPQIADSLSLFNPMVNLYRKGAGTLAYRDRWNLFDQFLLSPSVLAKENGGYFFWKVGIYNPPYLQNTSGRYKGYPFRTYVGTTYQGGYADHFPVYLYLVRDESFLLSKE